MSNFQDTEDRASIMSVVSNMKAERVIQNEDDGIGQKVQVSAGVHLKSHRAVPNPVMLKPWRTFREVEQPESAFVFRVFQQEEELPTCALFEADGGSWKLEAIRNISEYLNPQLEGFTIIS